ncbi:hypothetical protein [Oryza sativa Japonica Group]|uniref:Uncharacterized protein n=1 Tax=Oryza sativa subsp. japonica TaxID=39947 RepID=Q1EHU1_ORYSJ|nr:hypothetical protein [Oryza sativa Japonica Group]
MPSLPHSGQRQTRDAHHHRFTHVGVVDHVHRPANRCIARPRLDPSTVSAARRVADSPNPRRRFPRPVTCFPTPRGTPPKNIL